MSVNRVEGTILNVQLSDDILEIRLDTYVAWLGHENSNPIVTLCLVGCPDMDKLLMRLRLHVGKYLFLAATAEDSMVVSVFLEIDDGDDEIEVICNRVTKEHSEYTLEEIHLKCQWLLNLYSRSEDERIATERQARRFTTELKNMVNSELDRSQRKLEFFRKTNLERASEMQGRIAAYERVLMKMVLLAKPDEGAA